MCTLDGEERVGVAHDGADVEVVAPVLDRHVERVASAVEVGDDRLDAPVAVAVDDVAAIAAGEQLGVESGVVGPGLGVGADADVVAQAEPASPGAASGAAIPQIGARMSD